MLFFIAADHSQIPSSCKDRQRTFWHGKGIFIKSVNVRFKNTYFYWFNITLKLYNVEKYYSFAIE